jgi:tetratricopeptide (TPR) repeat protein
MSDISFLSFRMPAAALRRDNPLPPLFNQRRPHKFTKISDVPSEIIDGFKYGFLPNNAPYTFQDDYSRHLKPTEFKTAVLENEFLKATFLLEFGGRLWSLFHKPTNRELLFTNPDFQIANLAIRNAWFCGGVEWNTGTIGHSPFTCSKLFTAILSRPDSIPVLRMYEWERFRQAPFQLDFYLPEKSRVLYVFVSIQNPNDWDIPIYWWTNLALPDEPGVRVIAPAESAFCLGCQNETFIRIPIPNWDGTDYSYPENIQHAADLFYDIPINNRHWIAAVDNSGRGLIQVSTDNLIGRKLWVWGSSPGGKNWQKFLSPRGGGYIEIQSGITQTQLEHFRLTGKSQLSWMEAYGLLEVDPEIAHGPDWDKTINHVENELDELISEEELLYEYRTGENVAHSPLSKIVQLGSGWGALENRRRISLGGIPVSSQAVKFIDDSLSAAQMPWINLLTEGEFPKQDPQKLPDAYIVNDHWYSLLKTSMEAGRSQNWFAWFHIGVIRYHQDDIEGAREAWEKSLELSWSAWSARCLGILCWKAGNQDKALEYLLSAYYSQPDLTPLAFECAECMLIARRYKQLSEFTFKLPTHIQNRGRMRLMHAQSALKMRDLETVKKFFDDRVIVDDLREGEQILSDFWFEY